MRATRLSFACAAAIAAAAWFPASAFAECDTDADCGDGYTCEVVGGSGCAEPACPPGEDCPEPPPCEPEEYRECVLELIECDADADCGEGFGCLTYTYYECHDEPMTPPRPGEDEPGSGGSGGSGSDTPPDGDEGDEDFGEPEPDDHGDTPGCEEVTESFCAPEWLGSCETDADCGEGFTCTEIEECSCSGSSGGGSSGGGVPTPAPDPDSPDDGADSGGDGDAPGDEEDTPGDDGWEEDCTCEGVGEFYCQPEEIECEADTDCPGDWTCETFDEGGFCTYDEETGEEICEEFSSSFCAPPHWDDWVGGAPGSAEAGGDPRPGRGEDLASGGSNGGEESDPTLADDDGERRASPGGACTAAPQGAAGGAMFGFLMLALAWRRRR